MNIKSWLKKIPILIALVLTIVSFLILRFFEIPTLNELENLIFSRLINAVIILITIFLIAGKKEVEFSTIGFLYALKKSWWILFLSGFSSLFIYLGAYFLKFVLVENFYLVLVEVIILSLCVGIFEEGLFRGIILNAFLKYFGSNFKGIIISILFSSFIFGYLHVYSNFFNGEINDWITLIGALGKILQAGIIGILFSVIYIRNKNLWSIAFIHALNDLLILIPTEIFNFGNIDTYVLSGTDGILVDIMYVIAILFMVPLVIITVKQITQIRVPQFGFFEEQWKPEIPVSDNIVNFNTL